MSRDNHGSRHGNLVALTWQQITIGLLILPLIFSIVFACYAAPQYQVLAYGLVGGIVLTGVGLTVLHLRSTGRADLQPDVLAIVFNAGEIRECTGVHIVGRAQQVNAAIRWDFAVQNLMDRPRRAQIEISPLNDGDNIMGQTPPIALTLGPSAVVVARVDVPLRGTARAFTLAMNYRVRVSGQGGNRVRFARRNVIAEPNKALAAATIAAGLVAGAPVAVRAGRNLIHDGGLPTITVDLEPQWGPQVAAGTVPATGVFTAVLWAPGEDADPSRLRARHRDLTRRPGPFPAAA